MREQIKGAASTLKHSYTEPWSTRHAWANVTVWSVITLVLLTNMAINLLTYPTAIRWVWLGCTVLMLAFDITLVKWSIEGLRWRRAVNETHWIEDQFRALVAKELNDGR